MLGCTCRIRKYRPAIYSTCFSRCLVMHGTDRRHRQIYARQTQLRTREKKYELHIRNCKAGTGDKKIRREDEWGGVVRIEFRPMIHGLQSGGTNEDLRAHIGEAKNRRNENMFSYITVTWKFGFTCCEVIVSRLFIESSQMNKSTFGCKIFISVEVHSLGMRPAERAGANFSY